MTDSLISFQLGVPDNSGQSAVWKSDKIVPISIRDYSPKQRLLTTVKETPGNKHKDIYISASQSVQQKQGLGKTSCWQVITQTRLSPLQSTHTKVFIGQSPMQLSLSIACTASELVNKLTAKQVNSWPELIMPPPPQFHMEHNLKCDCLLQACMETHSPDPN